MKESLQGKQPRTQPFTEPVIQGRSQRPPGEKIDRAVLGETVDDRLNPGKPVNDQVNLGKVANGRVIPGKLVNDRVTARK